MSEQIERSAVIPSDPETLYASWIDGERHATMTGSPATSAPQVGGEFTAWNGFIWGRWEALEPGVRIEMTWTTQAFPEGAPPSRVDVRFIAADGGTTVAITHTNIPDGQGAAYHHGWLEKYFEPMTAHFGS